jgi:hypothetical protein
MNVMLCEIENFKALTVSRMGRKLKLSKIARQTYPRTQYDGLTAFFETLTIFQKKFPDYSHFTVSEVDP